MYLYDRFTDFRDNTVYPVVTIGNQIWMAKNLAYRNSGCKAPNNNSNNISTYGCLYSWDDYARNICPSGWRLPTKQEFEELLAAVGNSALERSKNLRSTSYWPSPAGLNTYGFNALPAGYYNSGFGSTGYFWSASEDSYHNAYYLEVNSTNAYLGSWGDTYDAFSVRCVKN